VCRRSHEPPDLNQDRLHCKVPLPRSDTWQLRKIDFAVRRVDAGQVDFGQKRDLWRLVGVVWAAVDLETIDSVLVG